MSDCMSDPICQLLHDIRDAVCGSPGPTATDACEQANRAIERYCDDGETTIPPGGIFEYISQS